MRHIYEKLIIGNPLTDNDIQEGIEEFTELRTKLESLGPVFRLATNEVNRMLYLLWTYRNARVENEGFNPQIVNDNKVEVDRDDLAVLLYFKDDSDTFQSAVERVRNAHRGL